MRWIAFGAALAATALAGTAFLGATAWSGRAIGDRVRHEADTLQYRLPFLRGVRHDFARGLFRTTSRLTLDIGCLGGAQDAAPLAIEITSQVRHGPFADGTWAAGVVDSEVRLAGGHAAAVEAAFAGRPLLSLRTVVAFDGATKTSFASPRATHASPTSGTFVWEGLTGSMEHGGARTTYALRGDGWAQTAPGGEASMRVGAFEVAGERDATSQEARGSLSSATLAIRPPPATPPLPIVLAVEASASGIRFAGRSSSRGDLLDSTASAEGDTLLDGSSYRFAFKLAVARLHQPTVGRLRDELTARLTRCAGSGDGALALPVLGERLGEGFLSLLRHDPELSLEEEIADGAGRRATGAWSIAVQGGAAAEPTASLAWILAHVRTRLALRWPLAWLREAADSAAAQATGEVASRALLDAAIEQGVAQGLILLDGADVTTEIALADGELLVNGKPMTPPMR